MSNRPFQSFIIEGVGVRDSRWKELDVNAKQIAFNNDHILLLPTYSMRGVNTANYIFPKQTIVNFSSNPQPSQNNTVPLSLDSGMGSNATTSERHPIALRNQRSETQPNLSPAHLQPAHVGTNLSVQQNAFSVGKVEHTPTAISAPFTPLTAISNDQHQPTQFPINPRPIRNRQLRLSRPPIAVPTTVQKPTTPVTSTLEDNMATTPTPTLAKTKVQAPTATLLKSASSIATKVPVHGTAVTNPARADAFQESPTSRPIGKKHILESQRKAMDNIISRHNRRRSTKVNLPVLPEVIPRREDLTSTQSTGIECSMPPRTVVPATSNHALTPIIRIDMNTTLNNAVQLPEEEVNGSQDIEKETKGSFSIEASRNFTPPVVANQDCSLRTGEKVIATNLVTDLLKEGVASSDMFESVPASQASNIEKANMPQKNASKLLETSVSGKEVITEISPKDQSPSASNDKKNSSTSKTDGKASCSSTSPTPGPQIQDLTTSKCSKEKKKVIPTTRKIVRENMKPNISTGITSQEMKLKDSFGKAPGKTMIKQKKMKPEEPVMIAFKHLVKTVVSYNQKHSFRGRQFVENRKSYLREILQKIAEKAKSEPEPELILNAARINQEAKSVQPYKSKSNDPLVQQRERSKEVFDGQSNVRHPQKTINSSKVGMRQLYTSREQVKQENVSTDLLDSKKRSMKGTGNSGVDRRVNEKESEYNVPLTKSGEATGLVAKLTQKEAEHNIRGIKSGKATDLVTKVSKRLGEEMKVVSEVGIKISEWKQEFVLKKSTEYKNVAKVLTFLRHITEFLTPGRREELFDDVSDEEVMSCLSDIDKCSTPTDFFWKQMSGALLGLKGAKSPMQKEESLRIVLDHVDIFVYLMKWYDAVFQEVLNRCDSYYDEGPSQLSTLEKFKLGISAFLGENDKYGNIISRLRKIAKCAKQGANHPDARKAVDQLLETFNDLYETAKGLSRVANKILELQDTIAATGTASPACDQAENSSPKSTLSPHVHQGPGQENGTPTSRHTTSDLIESTLQESNVDSSSAASQRNDAGRKVGKDGEEFPSSGKGTGVKRKWDLSGIESSASKKESDNPRTPKRRAVESNTQESGENSPEQVRRNSSQFNGSGNETRGPRDVDSNTRRDNRTAIKQVRQDENPSDLPPIPRISKNTSNEGYRNARGNDKRLNVKSTASNTVKETALESEIEPVLDGTGKRTAIKRKNAVIIRATPHGPFLIKDNTLKTPSINQRSQNPNVTAADNKRITSILKHTTTDLRSENGTGPRKKHEKGKRVVKWDSALIKGTAVQNHSMEELSSLFSHGYDMLGELPLQRATMEERISQIPRGVLGVLHGLITRRIENLKREVEGASPITSDRMRLPYAPSCVLHWARQFNITLPEGRPNTSQNPAGRILSGGIGLRSAPAPPTVVTVSQQFQHQQRQNQQQNPQQQQHGANTSNGNKRNNYT